METKHIIGLIGLLILTGCTLPIAIMSQRARDAVFFFLLLTAILPHGITINLLGQYWYRGTTRGLEVSALDVFAFCILVASYVAPRYPGRRWIWPVGFTFLLIYLLDAALSVALGQPKIMGVWELGKMIAGLQVMLAAAAYVRTRRELAVVVLALGCAAGIEVLYGLRQRYMMGMYRVPGTTDHENSLSMYMCTISPMLLAAAFADWWKPLRWFAGIACACAAVTEMLTLSRAGIPDFWFVMGGVALACNTWKLTWRRAASILAISAAAGLLVYKSWDLLAMRYESASLSEEYLDEDTEGRGVYLRWAAAIIEDHPLGIGLNNWSYYVSKIYGPQIGYWYEDYDDIKNAPEKADLPSFHYAAPAHSLAALTLGELGIPGLLLFSLIWLRWFQAGATFLRRRLNPDPVHRLGIGCFFAVWGIFLQSTTEWTYRLTTLLFTFHILMGVLSSLYYMKRCARVAERETLTDEDDEIEVEAEEIPAAN